MELLCRSILPSARHIDGVQIVCDRPRGHDGVHVTMLWDPQTFTAWAEQAASYYGGAVFSGWTVAQLPAQTVEHRHVVSIVHVSTTKVRPVCNCGAYGHATPCEGIACSWQAHHLKTPDCTSCTRYGAKPPLQLS